MPGIFDEFARTSPRVASRQKYVIPLSMLAHTVLLALVIVVPLLAAGALPMPASVLVFTTPPASPPPPPPPPAAPAATKAAAVEPRTDAAPIVEPAKIVAEPPASRMLGDAMGVPGGVPWGVPGGTGTALAQPPTVADPPAPHPPIRPGGDVKEPKRLHYVAPVYPRLAIAARSEGVVLVEAELSADGTVTSARIIRSVPLLDAAALDAVRQWTYTPTLLNGVPVPVLMTVTVIFTLR